MKKLVMLLMLSSIGCFAQDSTISSLEKMHADISAGRSICAFKAQMGAWDKNGNSGEVNKCKTELLEKADGLFNASKARLEKKPTALTALKNYYAAAQASIQQIGGNDRRMEDQAALRTQELFNLLKMESGS